MMNFLVKIENLLNSLLLKLGELMMRFVPKPIKKVMNKLSSWYGGLLVIFRALPKKVFQYILKKINETKVKLQSINLKAAFLDSYQKAMADYKENSKGKANKFKTLFLTPFLVIAQWLQGLSPAQSLLLLTFTGLSFLSVIGIGFSGKRIVDAHVETSRAPASAEEIEYDRPGYYKKQFRHLDITNFRLPVYVAKVNEIRSVDIDFTATISNRNARLFLEKHEFHLRDHLILHLEPSIAAFPLEEEGKEIIRQKLWREIDTYLRHAKVEGKVTELKITYVLAN